VPPRERHRFSCLSVSPEDNQFRGARRNSPVSLARTSANSNSGRARPRSTWSDANSTSSRRLSSPCAVRRSAKRATGREERGPWHHGPTPKGPRGEVGLTEPGPALVRRQRPLRCRGDGAPQNTSSRHPQAHEICEPRPSPGPSTRRFP